MVHDLFNSIPLYILVDRLCIVIIETIKSGILQYFSKFTNYSTYIQLFGFPIILINLVKFAVLSRVEIASIKSKTKILCKHIHKKYFRPSVHPVGDFRPGVLRPSVFRPRVLYPVNYCVHYCVKDCC